MKHHILSRVFFVFGIVAQIILPGSGFAGGGADTLSPSVTISSGALTKSFAAPEPSVRSERFDVVLEQQSLRKRLDGYLSEITIRFRYDHPGILRELLAEFIAVNNRQSNARIVWEEMTSTGKFHALKFGVMTDEKKDIHEIIHSIRNMPNLKRTVFPDKQKVKYVLEVDCPQGSSCLVDFANYFASNNINVVQFLSFRAEKDVTQYVFEIDIPGEMHLPELKSEIQRLVSLINGGSQMRPGPLLDKVLDEYLLHELSTPVSPEGRMALRRALKVIAARRIGEARRDRKTPFVMHAVEIAKLLDAEIHIFRPELLAYLSRELRMSEQQVRINILMAAILHDAVEDGDISQSRLKHRFNNFTAEIVDMVTKRDSHKTFAGEARYLHRLAQRKDLVGVIAQLVKIADRIHNLRTLVDNSPEFQRKIFFSTWDNFYIGEFLAALESASFENEDLRRVMEGALELFRQEVVKHGKILEFMDENGKIYESERMWYEWEEKARNVKQILAVAQKKGMIAHGVAEEKAGLQGLSMLISQGYIKARQTDTGMGVFAGPLRARREGENFNDYQAASAGPYGPYYVILDFGPFREDFRMAGDAEEARTMRPGLYKARRIDDQRWGIPDEFHAAYLVPSETDREFIINHLRQSDVDEDHLRRAVKKIITYEEFIRFSGNIQMFLRSVSLIRRLDRLIAGRAINQSL